MTNKEIRLVTRGIKNCRDSRLFKGCSPLQPLCNLTGLKPAIPNDFIPPNVLPTSPRLVGRTGKCENDTADNLIHKD
jgi:hypothetical protein